MASQQIKDLTNAIKVPGTSKEARMILLAQLCRSWGCGIYCWKGIDPGGSRRPPSNSKHNQTFGMRSYPNIIKMAGYKVGSQNKQRLGRAFDVYIGQPASNVPKVRASFGSRAGLAVYIRNNFTPYLTEGIYNRGIEGKNLSVANGKSVPASHWGTSVWNDHNDHIHIAF